MSSLGAFIETVKVYREKSVCEHHWHYGEKLRDGLLGLAKEVGVAENFGIDGPAICMNYSTRDGSGQPSLEFRTLFAQEMARHGVLMCWISVSLSHGEAELQMTLDAARKSLKVYVNALNDGVGRFLEGPAVKPVFRQFN